MNTIIGLVGGGISTYVVCKVLDVNIDPNGANLICSTGGGVIIYFGIAIAGSIGLGMDIAKFIS